MPPAPPHATTFTPLAELRRAARPERVEDDGPLVRAGADLGWEEPAGVAVQTPAVTVWGERAVEPVSPVAVGSAAPKAGPVARPGALAPGGVVTVSEADDEDSEVTGPVTGDEGTPTGRVASRRQLVGLVFAMTVFLVSGGAAIALWWSQRPAAEEPAPSVAEVPAVAAPVAAPAAVAPIDATPAAPVAAVVTPEPAVALPVPRSEPAVAPPVPRSEPARSEPPRTEVVAEPPSWSAPPPPAPKTEEKPAPRAEPAPKPASGRSSVTVNTDAGFIGADLRLTCPGASPTVVKLKTKSSASVSVPSASCQAWVRCASGTDTVRVTLPSGGGALTCGGCTSTLPRPACR